LTTKGFEKLLGSNTYAKSTHAEEAINMLRGVLNEAVALAGGKPCIALTGYAYVVTLIRNYTRPITTNVNRVNRFLLKLIYKVVIENQIVSKLSTSRSSKIKFSAFIIDKDILTCRNKQILDTFQGLIIC